MVTYEPGVDTGSEDRDRVPDPRTRQEERAPRLGAPHPDGALARTRRVVTFLQLALIAAAVLCGLQAAASSDTDLAASDRWTMAMATAICLVPLGGLLWWVERTVSEQTRPIIRRRMIGRRVRALLATVGLAGFFLTIFYGRENLSLVCFVVVLASPLAYAVSTLGGPSGTELKSVSGRSGTFAVRHRTAALAEVHEHRTVLLERDEVPDRLPRSASIRPREPVGVVVPRRLRAWLANGLLSTDGRSVSVTDARGQVHTRPLARGSDGEDPYGVATLVVRRERVRVRAPRAWSVPQYRRSLGLLDPDGRRLLDLELYGWTRSDLLAFARTAGLEVHRHEPEQESHLVTTMTGSSPSVFDIAYPRALGYARVPGGSVTGDVLLVAGAITVSLALATAGFLLGSWASDRLVPADSPVAGLIGTGSLLLVLAVGMVPLVAGFDRLNRKRQVVPGPPDAI